MPSLLQKTIDLRDALVGRRAPVTLAQLLEELGWPRSTFFRVLAKAREEWDIAFDEYSQGYRYNGLVPEESPQWKLGTLDLLALADRTPPPRPIPVVAKKHALRHWIETEMRKQGLHLENLQGRVRFAPIHWRPDCETHLRSVADAILSRRVIRFVFTKKDGKDERIVSPQRLVLYRSGWSLDAWDHGHGEDPHTALRQFALDAIDKPRLVNEPWREVSIAQLDTIFGEGYGLWSGASIGKARLLFTGDAAHYARREIWHPLEVIEDRKQHGVVKEFPYSGMPELVGDILRWGGEIRVLGDSQLKKAVQEKVQHLWKISGGASRTL